MKRRKFISSIVAVTVGLMAMPLRRFPCSKPLVKEIYTDSGVGFIEYDKACKRKTWATTDDNENVGGIFPNSFFHKNIPISLNEPLGVKNYTTLYQTPFGVA